MHNWFGTETIDPDSLMNWEELGRTAGYGTVGAVVFDGVGNLAAGDLEVNVDNLDSCWCFFKLVTWLFYLKLLAFVL